MNFLQNNLDHKHTSKEIAKYIQISCKILTTRNHRVLTPSLNKNNYPFPKALPNIISSHCNKENKDG